jgi:hypothetical protein
MQVRQQVLDFRQVLKPPQLAASFITGPTAVEVYTRPADQAGFLLTGLTPSVDASPNFSRSAASEAFPKSDQRLVRNLSHLADGLQIGCSESVPDPGGK